MESLTKASKKRKLAIVSFDKRRANGLRNSTVDVCVCMGEREGGRV